MAGPAPDPPPSEAGWSESTRYLCAATHLDRAYRERVLAATVRETHRAVCPSYGVDLSVVARHAILARRRSLLRDAGLSVVLLAIAVAVWRFAAANGRDAGRVILVLAVLLGIAWIMVAVENWALLTTLGLYLRPGCRPDMEPSTTSPRTVRVLDRLAAAAQGNVIVYSIYQPFVGSGVLVDRSSYPVPLLPLAPPTDPTGPIAEAGRRTPIPFRAGELVHAIGWALHRLRLTDLRIERRLFVGGMDVSRFRELLPDPRARPVIVAPDSLIDATIEEPPGLIRPYLSAQFTSWHGQLVVTTFIRIVVLTGLLFVETATYVLVPLREEYLAVDRMRIRTGRERLGVTLGWTTTGFLPDLLAAPVRLAAAVQAQRRAVWREREFARRLADRVRIDRGAASSIREEASRDDFDRYFMQLDAEMAISVVKQTVADTIARFLDDHNYQTEKINMIQNNISNTTVNDNSFRMGNVQGSTLAGVGQGARGRNTGSQNSGDGGSR